MKKTIILISILLGSIPLCFSQFDFVASAGENTDNCSWSFGQIFAENSITEAGSLKEGLQLSFLYKDDDTLLIHSTDMPYNYRNGHVIIVTEDTVFYMLPTYGIDSLMSVILYTVTCPNDTLVNAPYSVSSIPIIINRPLIEPSPTDEISAANNAPAEFPCNDTTTVIWQLSVADKTLECRQNIRVLLPPCGGNFTATDANGNIYNTLRLGYLCWTKENIKSISYDDGLNTPIPNALIYKADMYPDTTANLALYGRLYSWYSAMKVPESDNTTIPEADEKGNIQGVCPQGWRVPTIDEFQALYAFSSPELRTPDYWICPGNNNSDFSAFPGGIYNNTANSCFFLKGDAFFWSCSGSTTMGQYVHLMCNCPELLFNKTSKTNGMSIRCIKN